MLQGRSGSVRPHPGIASVFYRTAVQIRFSNDRDDDETYCPLRTRQSILVVERVRPEDDRNVDGVGPGHRTARPAWLAAGPSPNARDRKECAHGPGKVEASAESARAIAAHHDDEPQLGVRAFSQMMRRPPPPSPALARAARQRNSSRARRGWLRPWRVRDHGADLSRHRALASAGSSRFRPRDGKRQASATRWRHRRSLGAVQRDLAARRASSVRWCATAPTALAIDGHSLSWAVHDRSGRYFHEIQTILERRVEADGATDVAVTRSGRRDFVRSGPCTHHCR